MNLELITYNNRLFNKSCNTDMDCRIAGLANYSSLYCVFGKCKILKKAGDNCLSPYECASYVFYGPLACSESCKKGKECHDNFIQNTPFCCKGITKQRECNIERPGKLSGCSDGYVCSLENDEAICVDKKEKSWLIGTILSIFGNIFINLGINLMKLSYKQSYVNIGTYSVSIMRIGQLLYFIGKLSGYGSYIFGNQSLLAGLSATGLVSNSIFAPLINNEIFTWKDAVAILFVFVGSSFIISNSSGSHVIYSLCELLKMYSRRITIIWFSFIIFTIIVLFFIVKYVEVNSDWRLTDDSFTFLQTDYYYEEDGVVCKYLMVLVYVWLSSFIAAYSTLSAKSLGEIIDKTLGGDNQFRYKITYFFIFSLLACTLGQIYWLNRALKHYDSLLVIPIFHICWTLLSITTAGIYFQDFDHLTAKQVKNFGIGVGIILCGSVFLVLRIVNKNEIRIRRVRIPDEQYKDE